MPLGHPALRRVAFSSDLRMCQGLDVLTLCENLEFVDLWNCGPAGSNVGFCAALWRGGSRDGKVVWPSRSMLESLARLEGWDAAQLESAMMDAQLAADEKLRRALERHRSASLPRETALANSLLTSAVAACKAFDSTGVELSEAEEILHAQEESLAMTTVTPPPEKPRRISPEAFCRALRRLAGGFCPGGVELTEIFMSLDSDLNGALSLEDMLSLNDTPLPVSGIASVQAVFERFFGKDNDAAATELTKGLDQDAKIDKAQVVSGLLSAGFEDVQAESVAAGLIWSSGGVVRGVLPALDALLIEAVMDRVQTFRIRLRNKFRSSEKAFVLFDLNRSGKISEDEFMQSVDSELGWPGESQDEVKQQIFHVLDADGSDILALNEFQQLDTFDKNPIRSDFLVVSRSFQRQWEQAPAAFRAPEQCGGKKNHSAARESKKENISIVEFAKSWKALGGTTDYRFAFRLLDTNRSHNISRREWAALEVFPRIALAKAHHELRSFIAENVAGGIEEFFNTIYESE